MEKNYLFLLLLLTSVQLKAQQVPDTTFVPQVDHPRYAEKSGLVVGIDATHNNIHTLNGGFTAFGKLLKADGYRLVSVEEMTQKQLEQLDILVIANPIHDSNVGNWTRPIANAFPEEEVSLIEQWVSKGGRLLLIADHMPCAGAAQKLGEAFGFNYVDGFVINKKQKWPPETYSKSKRTLKKTILTQNIDQLASFTGSALKAPEDAQVVATFPRTHQLLVPEVAWQFNRSTKKLPVEEYVMGAFKPFGDGKIACFTEAAMFTAQIVRNRLKVGFNAVEAPQNQQFVLNVVHWLDNGKVD